MYTKEKFIFLFLNPIKRYDKRFKEGGVVHHLGDSHMNANVRFKFALTYDYPVILPINDKCRNYLYKLQNSVRRPKRIERS
jgi:hypothetical protein